MRNVEQNAPLAALKINGQLTTGEKIAANKDIMWFREVGKDGKVRYRLNPAWIEYFAPIRRDIFGFSSVGSDLPTFAVRKDIEAVEQPTADTRASRTGVDDRQNFFDALRLRFLRLCRGFNVNLKRRS
jgi:hypothetical protein